MLSKSAARAFFLGGTAVCSLAFIALSIDSFSKIPEQTHESELTESAVRGKDLWDQNNCMGCHTLLGEGAYYAPELTRVHTRRGPDFIRAMLKDPAAMYPGQRQMQKYDFTDEEIEDLVAFLAWIDKMDLNGFPATPNLSASAPGAAVVDHRPVKFRQVCSACHSLGGTGGKVGPALDGIGTRRDSDYLARWLKDPASVKPGTTMPKLPLSDGELTELVGFLSTQKAEVTP